MHAQIQCTDCIMKGFLAIIPVLLACATWAVPAQNLSSSNLPSEGSPSIAQSPATHTDLLLPISPTYGSNLLVYPSLSHRIGIPPHRSELAMTLALSAHHYWLDYPNTPLAHRREYRGNPPFSQFQHVVIPAFIPSAPLTPVKLGIAYCRMLLYVLTPEREISSGLLTARLVKEVGGGMIGIVSVENKPEAGNSTSSKASKAFEEMSGANQMLNSTLQPGEKASAIQLSDDETQRRWFGCLARMLFGFLVKSPAGRVADTLPSRELPFKVYRFLCVPTDPRVGDFIDLNLYPAAARYALSWQQLTEELLVLGSAVALGHPGSTTGTVREENTVLATLKLTVDSADFDRKKGV